MDKNLLNNILEQRRLLVPSLFTDRQINIIQKYFQQDLLNNTERAYFYSTIRKKIEAIKALQQEYYITGENMLPERVEQAKNILKELGQPKAFISGSFLYKKEFRDIDIFVISKRRESYHRQNRHFNFITPKILKNPIYLSSLFYSVANFSPEQITPLWKRPPLDHIIMTYEMAINEILNREEERTLRELIFRYYFHVKKEIVSSFSLYKISDEIIKKQKEKKINEINQMTKELILKLYSRTYLYLYLGRFVRMLKKDYATEPYDNYPIFIKVFTEVKNGCRIAKTKT